MMNAHKAATNRAFHKPGTFADWMEMVRRAMLSHQVERTRDRTLDQLATFPPIVRRDVGVIDQAFDQ